MALTWSTLWLACLTLGLVALARSATGKVYRVEATAGAAGGAEPPRVRLEPERQVVRPGASPRFYGWVQSDHPYSFHWETDGRSHPLSAIMSDDHVTLQFHNIPVYDQGRYIYRANNLYGTAQAAVEVVVEESTTTTAPMTTHETPAVDLGALLDAGATITLVAGDTRLAAHKAVLTARSPAFKAMLSGNTPEAGSGQLDVADVEGPVLRQLLAYMYTLQAPQVPSMAPQLLAAADSYGVPGLKAACERQLVEQLAVENAATSAALAVRHSCPRLKEAAVALIRANLLAVMATQGWARETISHPTDMVVVTRLVAELPAGTSPPPATEGGPTPGPQPHAGSGRTTAASEPATAASASTPGGGAVSSQSAAAAAGSTSAPGQARSGSSQTPAAPTPAPPACDAPLPDDDAVSRYRNLPAEERGSWLRAAAYRGAAGEVRALLAAGADAGAEDENAWTALHWAAERGDADVASCLLAGGADVDARDSWGQRTPLHLAAYHGRTAVVRLLAAASADPNARNQWGETPLHLAAARGHAEAAAALLQAGADRAVWENEGRTPLDLASNQQLAQLLAES